MAGLRQLTPLTIKTSRPFMNTVAHYKVVKSFICSIILKNVKCCSAHAQTVSHFSTKKTWRRQHVCRNLRHPCLAVESLCRHFCYQAMGGRQESTTAGVGFDTSSVAKARHIPVMCEEVVESLMPTEGQVIVDMTFGAGGHAKEILSRTPSIKYIASDRDPYAHGLATELASHHNLNGGQLIPVLSRFSELPDHFESLGIAPGSVDAFLLDLGASSMQFDQAARGFALSKDGPLDMRMDGQRFPNNPTAADVVNHLDCQDLTHIIKKYGEESRAQHIANAIIEARYAFGNFTRTQQLAEVIKNVFDSLSFRHDKLYRQSHMATKTFQALRIFVNNELNEIHNGLEIARHYLKLGGRCVVLTFHSLEDRIVKRHFHCIDVDEKPNMTIHDHFRNPNVSNSVDFIEEEYMRRSWRPLSRKIQGPSDVECYRNPRARSAKLRAAVKDDYIV